MFRCSGGGLILLRLVGSLSTFEASTSTDLHHSLTSALIDGTQGCGRSRSRGAVALRFQISTNGQSLLKPKGSMLERNMQKPSGP